MAKSKKKIRKRKKISKTEKSLRNKVYYIKSVIKEKRKDVEKYESFDENKMIKFRGKKRKIKTVKNILRNEIGQRVNKYNKTFEQLNKRFKKNYKGYSDKVKARAGINVSKRYFRWELNNAIEWINDESKKDTDKRIIEITELSYIMGNYDELQMYINKDEKFKAWLIYNG